MKYKLIIIRKVLLNRNNYNDQKLSQKMEIITIYFAKFKFNHNIPNIFTHQLLIV